MPVSGGRRAVACRSHACLAALFAAVGLGGAPHAARGDTEQAGDFLRIALPAAAFAITVRRDDAEGRRQFLRSFAANAGATLLLKSVVDDERPNGEDDDAFPSGHASVAFQAAGFVHRRYGARKAWPVYVLAGFVGWSRVDADEHDEADVLAGAALGVAASFLLTNRLDDSAQVTFSAGRDGSFALHFAGRF